MTQVNGKWTSCILEQWFCPNYQANRLLRVKTLNNPNLAAWRQIKTEKALIPVGVRRSKTTLLKFPLSAHWGMCKTVTSPQFRFLPQSPPKCVANRPLDEG